LSSIHRSIAPTIKPSRCANNAVPISKICANNRPFGHAVDDPMYVIDLHALNVGERPVSLGTTLIQFDSVRALRHVRVGHKSSAILLPSACLLHRHIAQI
jgi:hypothetical protein